MAKIDRITLYHTDNYVCYDDTDPQSDYFNSYSLSLHRTIEWVREDGADTIRVDVVNNDPKIPALKRVKKIAKEAGYTIEDRSHIHVYNNAWGIPEHQRVKRWRPEFILQKLLWVTGEQDVWNAGHQEGSNPHHHGRAGRA